MQGASLDDIYSDDYTYKDNLTGDPHESSPPSQHAPGSDYRPTPSLDENGTVFPDQYNDHDAVDKGNANAKDSYNTAEWVPDDNLIPLHDNKCSKFLANYIQAYTKTHNIKSDISRAGLIMMIEGAGLDYWGVLASITKSGNPTDFLSSKFAHYIINETASYVGEMHSHPYSPGAIRQLYIAAAILVVAYDFGLIYNQGMKDPHKFFQTLTDYEPDSSENIEMLYWFMRDDIL
jgi:hypothetical protein